tara:strand:- start:293 stop:1387 length:1095 start_codon:yes stop_codon:yes gene_type:complete
MYIFLKYNKIKSIKGILIITHKELNYNELLIYLNTIRSNYYILVHNGSINKPQCIPLITFNLTTETNNINNNCLSFTSRNFLDNIFNNSHDTLIYNKFENILQKYNLTFNFDINTDKKIFDFICVNRSAPIKLTLELLKNVIYFIKNTNKTACFIIIEDNINNPYYLKIIDYYQNNKTNNLLFINGINLNNFNNSIWTGLTRNELAELYKLSKIYMHSCEAEGESRTIHEALACGCMVLAKKNMRGGGLDYLNNYNSVLYDNSDFFEKMYEITIKYNHYKYDYNLFKKINITYSSNIFKKKLYDKLYKSTNLSYEEFEQNCNIENMMDKLPAHDISEPWYLSTDCTADIKHTEQIIILNNLINT